MDQTVMRDMKLEMQRMRETACRPRDFCEILRTHAHNMGAAEGEAWLHALFKGDTRDRNACKAVNSALDFFLQYARKASQDLGIEAAQYNLAEQPATAGLFGVGIKQSDLLCLVVDCRRKNSLEISVRRALQQHLHDRGVVVLHPSVERRAQRAKVLLRRRTNRTPNTTRRTDHAGAQ